MDKSKKLLADLKAEAKALLDKVDAEQSGLMTEAQSTKFDELTASIEGAGKQIEQRAKLEASSEFLSEPAPRQVGAHKIQEGNNRFDVKDAVENDPMRGFSDAADFATAVASVTTPGADSDPRLRIMGAATSPHRETGSTTGDGYMVPPQMRDSIFEIAFEQDSTLINAVQSEVTNSNAVELMRDESTAYGATGVKSYWTAETAQGTESNLLTEGSTVKLNKLFALVTASEELLEDAPRLNQRLTRGAGRAINWEVNKAIMNGTGAGQPLGYRESNALVTVAKESAQTADTIVAANLAKMYSRNLNPTNGIWLANADVFSQLVGMTIGDQPVFTLPQGGITSAPSGFIFGRPVMFTEHCETLGDAGDIQFIDPMGYYLARKAAGIKFDSSIHLYFDYDVQAFKWTFRVGGQPFLSAPVSPNKGSATKSHFVELAARA